MLRSEEQSAETQKTSFKNTRQDDFCYGKLTTTLIHEQKEKKASENTNWSYFLRWDAYTLSEFS